MTGAEARHIIRLKAPSYKDARKGISSAERR